MKIGTREVGPGHPTFIVAEVGSNHGGSLDVALALIDAAADAGADAVKFQLWNPDKMYDPNQFPDEYASAVKWQLPRMWLPRLKERATARGLAFGCSAFDFDSLDYVDQFVDFHKVASIEAAWLGFPFKVVKKGKPTFISNGMNDSIMPVWPQASVVTLHCVVSYPAAFEDLNLRAVPYGPPWGLSDHTTHPTIAPCAAAALGACVIEKHIKRGDPMFKDKAHLPPDWDHSLYTFAFKQMVDAIRQTEAVLGSSEKRIRPSEEPYLKYRRGPRGLRGA